MVKMNGIYGTRCGKNCVVLLRNVIRVAAWQSSFQLYSFLVDFMAQGNIINAIQIA